MGPIFCFIIFLVLSKILNDIFANFLSFSTTLSMSPVSLMCVAKLLYKVAESSVFSI